MRLPRAALIAVVGWYYILITAHYFGQRPVWNDEQCVLNSIIHLKPSALFSQPLLNLQEFPRFYLFCIQQLSLPFQCHLLALRLIPFLAMATAFFVWFKVVQAQSKDLRSLILFVGCWCSSIPLVYHAGELKPYSMDVLVSGLFMLFLYHQPELQKKTALYRSILFLLPLLGILSYPVIFLYPLALYNLISDAYARRKISTELLCYLAGGILWVSFVYFFDYRVTTTAFLQTSWDTNFINFGSVGEFFNTFGKQFNNLMSRWFAEKPHWIRQLCRVFIGSGFLYMLINFWRVFKAEGKRFRSLMPAALAVFLMHLALGCLHKYPFSIPRLSLFIAPFLIWMTVLGLEWLRGKSKTMGLAVELIFMVYLIVVSLGISRVVFACNPSLHFSGPGLGGQSVLWQK